MVSTGRTLQGPGSFQCVSLIFSCLAWQLLSCMQHFVCIHTARRPIANFTNVGLIRASILYSRILLFTVFFCCCCAPARQHQTAVTKRAAHGKTADLRSCCILFLHAGKRQHYCHQAVSPPTPLHWSCWKQRRAGLLVDTQPLLCPRHCFCVLQTRW